MKLIKEENEELRNLVAQGKITETLVESILKDTGPEISSLRVLSLVIDHQSELINRLEKDNARLTAYQLENEKMKEKMRLRILCRTLDQ